MRSVHNHCILLGRRSHNPTGKVAALAQASLPRDSTRNSPEVVKALHLHGQGACLLQRRVHDGATGSWPSAIDVVHSADHILQPDPTRGPLWQSNSNFVSDAHASQVSLPQVILGTFCCVAGRIQGCPQQGGGALLVQQDLSPYSRATHVMSLMTSRPHHAVTS